MKSQGITKIRIQFLVVILAAFLAFDNLALAVNYVPMITNSPFQNGVNPACGVCTNGTQCCGTSSKIVIVSATGKIKKAP